MKKVTLKIEGMSCSACSNGLEKYLNKQDGIIGANVNLVMNNATIEYNEDKLNINDLNIFVSKAGFKSLGIDDFKQKARKNKYKKIEVFILLALSILIMYVSMGHMLNLPTIKFLDISENKINYCIALILLSIFGIILGKDIIISGIKNIFHLMPNMDTLVTIGILSSFLYSLSESIKLFLGGNLGHVYFEASVMVIFFIKLGRYIDDLSKSKTTEAIEDLMLLTPSYASVYKGEKIVKVTIDEISKGDIVVSKSGETIAVDGKITKGICTIDESFITGESIPKLKKEGDFVIAGSVNCDGYIEYEALKIGKESTVSEIVRMVVEATNTKAPISRIADTVSKYFVMGVILIAMLGFIYYLAFKNSFDDAINAFVTVLVVACPCALGLATPIAMVVSNGKSAKLGILVKNNAVLEMFNKINTIVFDKTGTLTEGKLKIDYEKYLNGISKEEALTIIKSLEKGSNHPIAKALEEITKDLEPLVVDNFRNISGMGITGIILEKEVLLGNEKLLNEFNIKLKKEEKELIDESIEKGNTILLLVVDGTLMAILGAKDSIKTNVVDLISRLKKRDIETIMLTGDNQSSAQKVAKELNITSVISDVLPKEKANVIKNIKASSKVVAMVGDGINDAPSLALADVGISMSNATDIAMNSADVIIINSSLEKIIDLLDISKKTIRIVKENLFWAFLYNACLIPIALGALSSFGISINPMIASVAMMLSSLSVILNALRLKR